MCCKQLFADLESARNSFLYLINERIIFIVRYQYLNILIFHRNSPIFDIFLYPFGSLYDVYIPKGSKNHKQVLTKPLF